MRGFGCNWQMVIDPNGTKLQLTGQTHGTPNIPCKDRSSETIYYVVTQMQRLHFILKFLHSDDRAKHLTLHDLPILLNIGDDSCLVIIAFLQISGTSTTRKDFCAL